MTTTDERQWLERARAGDKVAFGKLIRAYQQRVHRLALHLMGNAGEADDVTQETFLRAFRAIERFDGRAELFTWLYRITVNVALNHRRARRRVTVDVDDPRVPEQAADGAHSDPARAAANAQAYRSLAQAMDGLSESLRTTLVLACVEGVPHAELAQVLGCSEGTVAWRVHEARRKLREALGAATLEAIEETGVASADDKGARAAKGPKGGHGGRRA